MKSAREVVLAWIDALNNRDAEAIAVLCHEDVVNLQMPIGDPSIGRPAMLEHFPRLFNAFPDCRVRSLQLLEDNEWAILEWELTGTWQGMFFGHQPNGHSIKVRGCEIFQVANGMIKSQRGYWDKATWFGQLGIPLE
ncbi:ester cyclase [Microbulbifer taiwanensis]|uniref:Ester cyclase n=2 Tax=Microbulbifer taiwanensis TaxID=986746 RepID=A0ABW1YRM4_9GAMM